MLKFLISALGGGALMFAIISYVNPSLRGHGPIFASVENAPAGVHCPYVIIPVAIGILLLAVGYKIQNKK